MTFLFVGSSSCLADYLVPNYGLLYEGNGNQQLQFNNSNLVGNIGIGATGQAQLNGPGTITGSILFYASNTGQYSDSGVTVTGSVTYGNTAVNTALTNMTGNISTTGANQLSQLLGLETGTSTTITSGGSITAGSGTLDGNGNRVFTVTSISFANGTFTINGAATDYVVLNVAGGVGSNGLNGSIVLAGGITSDHVLINYTPDTSNLTTYNNDYATLMHGPTLTISTNGANTTGIFLDPTGDMQVNHSDVFGRLIGGDTQNFSFVSGANLTTPVPATGLPLPAVVPSTLLLLGGLFAARKLRLNRGATIS